MAKWQYLPGGVSQLQDHNAIKKSLFFHKINKIVGFFFPVLAPAWRPRDWSQFKKMYQFINNTIFNWHSTKWNSALRYRKYKAAIRDSLGHKGAVFLGVHHHTESLLSVIKLKNWTWFNNWLWNYKIKGMDMLDMFRGDSKQTIPIDSRLITI